jgi:hypothetical protein
MAKSRTLFTVALASMALVLVAGPVVGHKGEGDTHRGKVGRHAFRDSDLKPGARCIYREVAPAPTANEGDAAMELVGVSVRAPKVAAINRTRRIDRQPVAWRFILQEKTDDGDWTKVKRSRTQVRRASDRRAARFSRLAIRYDGDPEADYRVVAKAYWLKKRNPLRKVGVESHLVDHYRVRGVVSEASCSGDGSVPVSETP